MTFVAVLSFKTKITFRTGICGDNPNWVGNQDGEVAKTTCADMTPNYCQNYGRIINQNYNKDHKLSIEAIRACPKACGVCFSGIDK